jgi:predicted nucleotidyltransferase
MLQKSSMFRTAEFFFVNPSKEHYLMDISRNIGLAHTSIKKNLKDLVKLGIINEHDEKKGERLFPVYHANLSNKLFKKYKLIHNLSFILESGLIDFIEEKLMPKSIVLFGSYSRGEDTETSDVDLFVECKKEELNLKLFEKKMERKIELHFKENFVLYPDELKNNIINGIVLSGFLEGYK